MVQECPLVVKTKSSPKISETLLLQMHVNPDVPAIQMYFKTSDPLSAPLGRYLHVGGVSLDHQTDTHQSFYHAVPGLVRREPQEPRPT